MWCHIIGEQRMFKIWEIVNEDQELSIAFEHTKLLMILLAVSFVDSDWLVYCLFVFLSCHERLLTKRTFEFITLNSFSTSS